MGKKKKRKHDEERPQGWFDPQTYTRKMKQGDYDQGNQYMRYANDMIPHHSEINNGQPAYNSDMYRRSGQPYYGNSDVYAAADDIRYRNRPEHDSMNRNPRTNEDHRWQDRNWWDRTADEVASWFGNVNAEERRRIDKIEGPYRGKGPKGYVRSDEKLTEEINDCLFRDSHIDASDIEVRVHNGEAVITGSVDDKMIKRRVEDVVEMIPGITNVENKLRIHKREENHIEKSVEPAHMNRRSWS
jgi:osmotically-inducible protein OsmY